MSTVVSLHLSMTCLNFFLLGYFLTNHTVCSDFTVDSPADSSVMFLAAGLDLFKLRIVLCEKHFVLVPCVKFLCWGLVEMSGNRTVLL